MFEHGLLFLSSVGYFKLTEVVACICFIHTAVRDLPHDLLRHKVTLFQNHV